MHLNWSIIFHAELQGHSTGNKDAIGFHLRKSAKVVLRLLVGSLEPT